MRKVLLVAARAGAAAKDQRGKPNQRGENATHKGSLPSPRFRRYLGGGDAALKGAVGLIPDRK